ncbi:MAG: ABC transporter ATP-binding protein [Bacillota bacterium]|nr:ABC transporter ATP-binding protein [Bacillota bacterium]
MFIEIKELTKYYGQGENKHKVLNSISASIEEGTITIIIGSSGSGKSTMLNCVGGLEKVDGGSITIDGVDIVQLSDKELTKYRRDSLGFVFQFYNLIQNLTVAENVDVCKYLTNAPLDRDELLKLLGIYDKKDCVPNVLSGGEQQRCAIARAVVKNPKLLLCDEPTGALDSSTAKEILCLLEKLNQEYGTTILMVTHNPDILPMAHQVITIKDGQIEKITKKRTRRAASTLNI